MEQDKFKYALKSNDAWASYKGHQNETFFPNLAKGQAPEICKFCAIAAHAAFNIIQPLTLNSVARVQ